MRRTGAGRRGLAVAALLALGLSLSGVFAPAAQAYDNPRQGEWYLDVLHMPQTWQTAKGSGVTVAVIDTGVKADHPDLAGQVLPAKDFSGLPGGAGVDYTGDGTRTASIIAGTGKSFSGKGVMGFAPGARILPIKVGASQDSTMGIDAPDYLKEVEQAITYAVDQGAKVIDVPKGVPSSSISRQDVTELQAAVDYAISHGRLVVSGAGDNGQQGNPVMYPADAAGVAAIAAVDRNGTSTAESEQGKYIGLAAPGVDVLSACTGSTGYCTNHGTASSAAIVSGMAAILFSQHQDWTGNQVLRVLMQTANKPNSGSVHSDGIGYGNASVSQAVQYTEDPGPPADSPLADISVDPPDSAFLPLPTQPAPTSPPTPLPTTPDRTLAPAVPRKPLAASGSSSGATTRTLLIGAAVLDALIVAGLVTVLVRRRRTGSSGSPAPHQASPVAPYHQAHR